MGSMAWAWGYFAASLVGAALVLNAFRPPRSEYLLVPSFFAGWYTGEMPVWHIVWQMAATAETVCGDCSRGARQSMLAAP